MLRASLRAVQLIEGTDGQLVASRDTSMADLLAWPKAESMVAKKVALMVVVMDAKRVAEMVD